MPTTPAELLAELHAAKAPADQEGPDSARPAGAASAVAALGGYLSQLYRHSPPKDEADLIIQRVADHQIATLAIACRALGQVASSGPHRLIDLAGGFADAAAITSAHATRDQRWAFTVATVEEIDHLATLVAAASPIGTGARERAERVRAATLPIQQHAARQPPTRAANALLDAPIPDAGAWPPRTQNATVGLAIHAAMATLLAGTRPSAQPLTIAEVLAIAIAAHNLCRAVDDPASHTRPGTAADAWSGVRTALAPFNDGSRRRHHTAPRHIAAARSIYDLTNERRFTQPDTATIDAIQRLPQLAEHLQITVHHWPWTSAILAHAYRLPAREERVDAILAGTRPSGIIRADPTDLTPVRAVLESARTLSVELAVRLSRQGSTTARRTLAAHQQWLSQPDSGRELAHAHAVATRHMPPAQLTAQPRRGRTR
jgi:hypothetical protein